MTTLDRVRDATWPLHSQAERSGVIAAILAGTATREAVALLWRNLLPVYRVLDATAWSRPELARAAAIEADLSVLAPDGWPALLSQGDRLAALPADPVRVIAHAYVRYLGDLNGGVILGRRLTACLGDQAARLQFLLYPGIADLPAYRRDYRATLSEAMEALPEDAMTSAVAEAFSANIALSEAIQQRSA
jgi:heme oxygenase